MCFLFEDIVLFFRGFKIWIFNCNDILEMFYKEVFSCLFLSLVVVMVIVIEEGFIKCLIVLVSMIEDLVVVVYFFKLCIYRLIFFEFLLELLLKELF